MHWFFLIFGGQYFLGFFLTFFVLDHIYNKNEKKEVYLHTVICTLIAGCVFNLLSYILKLSLGDIVFLYAVFASIASVLYITAFIKKDKVSAVITALSYISLCATAHYIVGYGNSAIFSPEPPDWIVKMVTGRFYWSYSLLTTVITLIIHWMIAIFLIKYPIKFLFRKRRYTAFMFLEPIMYLIGLYYLKKQFEIIDVYFSAILLLICFFINLFYYFISNRLMAEYQEKVSAQMVNREMDLQMQYVKTVQRSDDMLHKIMHDTKNHFLYLEYMLEEENYEGIREYFYKVQGDLYEVDNLVNSNNKMINALVNSKFSYAKSKGIKVAAEIDVPSDLEIEESHLCSFVMNLLDNAIDACKQVENGEIFVKIRLDKGYLYIEVKNTIKENILIKNPKLFSTKRDKESHGWGIQIVKEIVEIYDGAISFNVENNYFIVNSVINNVCSKKQKNVIA